MTGSIGIISSSFFFKSAFPSILSYGSWCAFNGNHGLRHDCPLSPYLFILAIEGLSLLIKNAQSLGLISGIKVTPTHDLTHLLFVDDILLFGIGTLSEWHQFHSLISLFCKASGMKISPHKSMFLCHRMDEEVLG